MGGKPTGTFYLMLISKIGLLVGYVVIWLGNALRNNRHLRLFIVNKLQRCWSKMEQMPSWVEHVGWHVKSRVWL